MPQHDAVTATEVEFRYGSHIAVSASSFTVPVGAITTLIGPNGSGKSTILNSIAGLITPSRGTLTVHGAPSRSRIALVLQMTKVNDALPITVREIVSMGRYPNLGRLKRPTDEDREIVEKAMDRMSIADLSSRHLRELSGGQRQRVFVAQGLAQDSDMLLLDEPLTGLDLPSAQAIDEVIHDERDLGRTIVMSTHDLAEAGVSDHVILVAGRVIACGKPEEVLTTSNLKQAYGSALLHVEDEKVFLDDPAHRHADEHHLHQDRTIHIEAIHDDGT